MLAARTLVPDLDGLDGIILDAIAAAKGLLFGVALMIAIAVLLRRCIG